MTVNQLIKFKSRVSLAVLSVVFLGIGFAVTQVQANLRDHSQAIRNNPHQIPEEFNRPQLNGAAERLEAIHYVAREEMAELKETLHSAAFKKILPLMWYQPLITQRGLQIEMQYQCALNKNFFDAHSVGLVLVNFSLV